MQAESLKKIDARIQRVIDQLAALGPMRPGTLTRQYRKPRERQGPFWQISYTHQMKSRTEYVRESELTAVRQEIAAFRRYKKLAARWVELALRRSQTRLHQARANANLPPTSPKNPPKTTSAPNGPTNIRATI